MQLSKKERKFRIRLIQENHFNKQEQRKLDSALYGTLKTYTQTYCLKRCGYTASFIEEIYVARAVKAICSVGVSASKLIKSFDALATAFQTGNISGGNNDI